MYYYLINRSIVDDQLFPYWERLRPELNSCQIFGEAREVENLSEARLILEKIVRLQKYQTIIVVGDDAFLAGIAGLVQSTPLVLGYIPISEQSSCFAQKNHISSQPGLVGNHLATRRYKKFNLGQLENTYFIENLFLGQPDSAPSAWAQKIPFLQSIFPGAKLFGDKKPFTLQIINHNFSLETDCFQSKLSVNPQTTANETTQMQITIYPDYKAFKKKQRLHNS
ncbi:MAG TPA: hypothetical protein ENN77_00125, partial [Candidatus Wirthbacteria bacterium]|nr:hypothetical protein [Candidatus Wirthbacteria bacterium]